MTLPDRAPARAPAELLRSSRPYPRIVLAAMVVSSLAYVILCMHVPVVLLADAGFDDYLFIQHGLSIISGQWLGPYSQMTLAKGPGYPLFLALNAALGVPVTLSHALLYVVACSVAARAIFRLSGSASLALICFLAIEWHPAVIPMRIVRDDLSAAQVLLILGAVCLFTFSTQSLGRRLLWTLFGGLALAWFWLTREDAVWVLPGLCVVILLQSLRLSRDRRGLLRLGLCGMAWVASTGVTLAAVAAVNLWVYGTFVTVDFKSADFEKALNILQTVRVGSPVPFVPVPAKVRQTIDEVSPAFASLEPYFKGVGQSWTAPGCAMQRSTCGDFAGGWFMWALRDAVAAEGHYRSPQDAARFYRSLWRQVKSACESGRLVCKPTPLPFMPATTAAQWRLLPHELLQMYRLATWQTSVAVWDFQHRFPKSSGDFTRLHTMEDFLRHPRRTRTASERGSVTINGWYHGTDDAWIRLRCRDADGELILPITRLHSPDLAVYFHTPKAANNRFSITVPNLQGCTLQAMNTATSVPPLALTALEPGITPFAGGQLSVDDIRESGPAGQFGIRILHAVNLAYAYALDPLTILAFLVFCVAFLWRVIRRPPGWFDAPLILIIGLWGLLLARAAVLVLVDLSSFPAITPLYWAAGYPLLCLVDLLSLALPFLSPAVTQPAVHARGYRAAWPWHRKAPPDPSSQNVDQSADASRGIV
ncbi:hypothetical protein [Acidisoma sp. 7E03]